MRNEKIVDSWNKVKPDKATHERILDNILERIHSSETQNQKGKVLNMFKKPYWKIIAPITACVLIALVAAIPTLLKSGGNDPILNPPNGADTFTLSRSSENIQVRYTDDIPNMPSSSALLAELTEAEIFNRETDIFSGTIQSIRNIEIDISGWVLYKSVAVIVVDEVLRGSIAPNDTVSILLDNVFRPDIWVEDTEVTSSMTVGMRGIFMPMKYDETSEYSYVEHNGETFYWLDIAQYRFSDGTRFAFLEAQDGLIFAQWVFESIANAKTLDEIKQYINTMIE